jgi:hypothetical protein
VFHLPFIIVELYSSILSEPGRLASSLSALPVANDEVVQCRVQMDIFDYEPIDLERPAIRLLQLLRGKGPAIECMLYQAYFDGTDTIPYDALSYNWGSTDGTSTMMVNGKTFSVAENLHSALQHLRSEDIDRVLWVDAICIDQANLRERGHAVSQLPLIYHTAQRTLCWTGAEHLTFLRKLTSTTLEVGDYQRAMVECLSEVDILHSMYRIAEHDLEVFGKEAEMFDSNTWHNLDAFLNQAYFNRYVQSFFRLLH